MEAKIKQFDIVVLNDGSIVQVVGKQFDMGILVEDIHTKTQLIHSGMIRRLANPNETKWFCEKTENSKFTPPTDQKIR